MVRCICQLSELNDVTVRILGVECIQTLLHGSCPTVNVLLQVVIQHTVLRVTGEAGMPGRQWAGADWGEAWAWGR